MRASFVVEFRGMQPTPIDPLFAEFPSVPSSEWDAQIARDLNGREARSLWWESEDGIEIRPYYRAEDVAKLPALKMPSKKHGWIIVADETELDPVTFTVDVEEIHRDGATVVQELAYALAAASDRLARGTAAVSSVALQFAVGSSFFFEIAKFRAARALWLRVTEAYNCEPSIRIQARTSGREQTVYDGYNNLLRGATQAMSAILGGCDVLVVRPFDDAWRDPSDFGIRLALNTQRILFHEAEFAGDEDQAAGCWYLEYLTDQVAQRAWNLFQAIEARGGLSESRDFVAKKVRSARMRRESEVANRRKTIVGVNGYANPAERVSEKIGKDLDPRRPAHAFEMIRLQTESLARRPRIFLLPIGDARMRRARADFCAGFFACAGFDVSGPEHCATVLEGVRKASAEGADWIALCSSDAERTELARQLCSSTEIPVIVAGPPEPALECVREFVNLKSNALEVLTRMQADFTARTFSAA